MSARLSNDLVNQERDEQSEGWRISNSWCCVLLIRTADDTVISSNVMQELHSVLTHHAMPADHHVLGRLWIQYLYTKITSNYSTY